MSEQTANLCTTDACESLRSRLAKYEDAEGNPISTVAEQAREIERLKEGQDILILARDEQTRLTNEYRDLWSRAALKSKPSGVVLADDIRAAYQNAVEVFAEETNAAQCREVAEYMREVLLVRLNSSPVSAGDDRKLSDIGNELHNLSCHVVHHNEGWANQLGTLASELWYWPSNAGVVDERAHPDEIAVDRFAVAMKEKLAKSREKGRHGWQNATQPHLSSLLYGHMYKADPLDVANLAMMLHQNGQAIELPWHARLNPHFKIPLGWRAQKTDGGDGFIVSSPRVNGVASNTAVFVDSPCPAHRMLFDVLAALTASAPNHGEQVREWIPVSERLPDEREHMRVFAVSALSDAVTIWATSSITRNPDGFAYWMPLPAAPSAGSQGGDV